MMKLRKLSVILISDRKAKTRQFGIPYALLRGATLAGLALIAAASFLVSDYMRLRDISTQYAGVLAENQHLKGEAQILIASLEEVKRSLRRVQDYTTKLGEIVNLEVSTVSQKTGIGPLSDEEFSIKKGAGEGAAAMRARVPLGINLDNLAFRPVLDELANIERQASRQGLELQYLLSTLSQKKSLLSSVPSVSPVDGWITSSFGMRISPFTGLRTMHKALDIAAPVGTKILAPADGVVIFSGAKAGFGNFIMIAHHGYGIVTRYGHNSQNMVQAGQRVLRGDQIGTVGMTGRTTGPHLHYEVWVNGRAVNPRKFILGTTLSL